MGFFVIKILIFKIDIFFYLWSFVIFKIKFIDITLYSMREYIYLKMYFVKISFLCWVKYYQPKNLTLCNIRERIKLLIYCFQSTDPVIFHMDFFLKVTYKSLRIIFYWWKMNLKDRDQHSNSRDDYLSVIYSLILPSWKYL